MKDAAAKRVTKKDKIYPDRVHLRQLVAEHDPVQNSGRKFRSAEMVFKLQAHSFLKRASPVALGLRSINRTGSIEDICKIRSICN